MVSTTSELILQQAITGDSTARRALVGKYRPLVRLIAARHARRLMGRRYDESDLVQITCLEAYRGFAGFNGATLAEFQSWLESILERQLVRLWRKNTAQKRDIRREASWEMDRSGLSFVWGGGSDQDPAQDLISGEVAVILAAALDQLPPEYRQVLEMRFIDQLKIRSIAERLEVSTGVVAGRLRRGLEELQQLLPDQISALLER